jgi:uncharacterized delta-60 repeat protein
MCDRRDGVRGRNRPGGRLLVVGAVLAAASAAWASGGALDSTFDHDGVVVEARVANGFFDAMAVQPDGKVVVVGTNEGSVNGWLVARYNPDGTPDASFGVPHGYVTFSGVQAQGVHVLADGRIVVAGWRSTTLKGSSHSDFSVRRLLPGGGLDTSFGSGGTVTVNLQGTSSQDFAVDMAVDSAGRIVLGGMSTVTTKKTSEESGALLRLLPDGTRDGSFGTAGIVIRSLYATSFDRIVSIDVEPDGSIVALGHGPSVTGGPRYHLIRFHSNGQADTAFGVRILANDHPSQGLNQMWDVDVEGLHAYVSGMRFVTLPGPADAVVVRYGLDGQPDTSYGTNGLAVYDGGGAERANGLAVRADGSAVVGVNTTTQTGQLILNVFRFDPFGQPDTTFGANGLGATSPLGFSPRAVVVDADDRVLAAGGKVSNHPAIARWTAQP